MNKHSLIYIIDDDFNYGRLLQTRLNKKKFDHVMLYVNEDECLKNITNHPKILIIDYHLTHMTGLQLIQKAKVIYPDFYSILLSGVFQNDVNKVNDERFIRYIDKFFIKGMNEINELIDTLTHIQPKIKYL